jgi:hypothetical protein
MLIGHSESNHQYSTEHCPSCLCSAAFGEGATSGHHHSDLGGVTSYFMGRQLSAGDYEDDDGEVKRKHKASQGEGSDLSQTVPAIITHSDNRSTTSFQTRAPWRMDSRKHQFPGAVQDIRLVWQGKSMKKISGEEFQDNMEVEKEAWSVVVLPGHNGKSGLKLKFEIRSNH